MAQQRYNFALEQLESGDWARFEKFASQFLVVDYPSLRTVAAPSGDGGRDSELFSPEGDPSVVLQYSLRKDWKTKIRETAIRIQEHLSDVGILIYVTNQVIGANADELKKGLRKEYHLILDIHDRSWFLDRVATDPERTTLFEALAKQIVDPYLASSGIVETKAIALTTVEAKAAVLHLQLQWEDDSREKGLTKLSFEALVKSALRETSSERKMKKAEVRDAVALILPSHPREQIDQYVNSAMERLQRKSVKHWELTDEVCLSHAEVLRVREGLANKELQERSLELEIRRAIVEFLPSTPTEVHLKELYERTRRLIDKFLLQRGEAFAAAVANGESIGIGDDAPELLITNDFSLKPDKTGLKDQAVAVTRSALKHVLQRSDRAVQAYLRETADAYTLFGFLRAVPDVQKAVQKVFSNGEIWLDTSVLLPVVAETLLDEDERLVTRLLRAAGEAGLKLRVTSGVIEEVSTHIRKCFAYTYTPSGQWEGGVPFLYAMYSLSGVSMGFSSWIDCFCGKERPADDLIDYLADEFGIGVEDLHPYVAKVDEDIRHEVERIWREAHEARRQGGHMDHDFLVVDRLIDHDVESFLGVIGKRRESPATELGYAQWWLTLDKTVRDIQPQLRQALGTKAPKPPVMSLDFLSNYLAIGPNRARLGRSTESALPVAMFNVLPDHIPQELLLIAAKVRNEQSVANERLLRRGLRDTLDRIKQHRGELGAGGFTAVRGQIEATLKRSAGRRLEK